MSETDLVKLWTDAGQGHVFAHVAELNADEKAALFKQLKAINPALVAKQLELARTTAPQEANVAPYTQGKTDEHAQANWKIGLKAVADGKCAALLLAGGQGTRLKTKSPKVRVVFEVVDVYVTQFGFFL